VVAGREWWNHEELMVDGRRAKATLNGAVILDENLDTVRDREVLWPKPPAASACPDTAAASNFAICV